MRQERARGNAPAHAALRPPGGDGHVGATRLPLRAVPCRAVTRRHPPSPAVTRRGRCSSAWSSSSSLTRAPSRAVTCRYVSLHGQVSVLTRRSHPQRAAPPGTPRPNPPPLNMARVTATSGARMPSSRPCRYILLHSPLHTVIYRYTSGARMPSSRPCPPVSRTAWAPPLPSRCSP